MLLICSKHVSDLMILQLGTYISTVRSQVCLSSEASAAAIAMKFAVIWRWNFVHYIVVMFATIVNKMKRTRQLVAQE